MLNAKVNCKACFASRLPGLKRLYYSFSCFYLKVLIYVTQGCALTAPGRVRKTTRSPGRALWLIVFLADKATINFSMLVVTVYENSQKMFFLRTKQSVQRPFT